MINWMDYIHKIIEDLVMQVWITDKDLKQQAVEELEDVLYDRLTISLVSKLDENWQNKVVDLMDNHKMEEVMQYLQNNVSNFDTEFEKVLVKFSGEYLQKMKEKTIL